MIKLENTEVTGWEATIRGMRNPMNSWDKSDSWFIDEYADYGRRVSAHQIINKFTNEELWKNIELRKQVDSELEYAYKNAKIHVGSTGGIYIGPADQDLMMRLARAGSVDAKFRRMITVTVDITAPLYWWKEFDTYKVGTVANSCSTMHKIHAKEFTLDDFSHDQLLNTGCDLFVQEFENGFGKCNVQPIQLLLDFIIPSLNTCREKFLETKDKKYWWQMIQLLPTSYNQKRTVQLNYEVLAGIYPKRKNHKLNEWHDFCNWIKALPFSEVITLDS